MANDPMKMVEYLYYWSDHRETFAPDALSNNELSSIAEFVGLSDVCSFSCRDNFFAVVDRCKAQVDVNNARISRIMKEFREKMSLSKIEAARFLSTKTNEAASEFEKLILKSFDAWL